MTLTFVAEVNKLKNLQTYLEKNENLLSHFAKYDSEFNLCEFFIETEKIRQNEEDQILKTVKDIWSLLREKKNLLRSDNISDIDLRCFKNQMIDIQEKIHTLKIKLKSTLESLKDEERTFSQINETYNQKISDWEKPLKKYSAQVANRNTSSCIIINKDVKKFMDFVNNSNGHENGWANEDHQLFLKFRKQYKNIETLALNLHKILPDFSIEDIKEHEDWYKIYLSLKAKKNEALQEWQNNKNEHIKKDNKTCDDCNDLPKKVYKNMINDEENIQQKLAQWKAEKAEKRRQEKIIQKMRRDEIKRKEEEKRKLQTRVKKAVETWKEAKTVTLQNELVHKEIEEYEEKKLRANEANKMIKKFQSQDDILVAKIRRRKLNENNKPKRSQSSYVGPRDPERLLKPTKQWLMRTSSDNYVCDGASTFVPNIREIPKLGVPQWRKNSTTSV